MTPPANKKVTIIPFSISPVCKEDELEKYNRLPEMVDALANEVVYSPGGCFLVTGYRGVGKTSFVNKVLYRAKESLAPGKTLLTVRLNLARGYDTDKLLRRMIRELFYTVNRSGVYEILSPESRRKFDIAFLRTSRQIKAALTQGLKEVVAHTESITRKTGTEVALEPSIGVDKISASLGSFSAYREKSKTQEDSRSQETASERGIELEFLEYDDEIAENDLCELIDLLENECIEEYTEEQILYREIRPPKWFWQRLPAEFRLFNKPYQNYIEKTGSQKHTTPKKLRVAIVLDEIDKMSLTEAEQVFRSLKNLFLKGNIIFILITGKAFYYEWLRKRTTEDDIFFSLFTRVMHIPLFNDEEFDTTAKQLSSQFPPDLLTHLKYKAKGTPREFLRELARFVQWQEGQPAIHISEAGQSAIDISGGLYPYIQQHYQTIQSDARIDPGIKDHLRRSLHNWLEWMTVLVIFTKPGLLRPGTEGEREADTVLFLSRTRSTFDDLFQSLLEDEVILDTKNKIGEDIAYTFTENIKQRLEEIDSTVSAALQSQEVAMQKELNRLLLEMQSLMLASNYEHAIDLIWDARKYFLDSAQTTELGSQIQNIIEALQLLLRGDKLYTNKEYGEALDAYYKAKKHQVDIPGLEEKVLMAMLQHALLLFSKAETRDAYQQAGANLLEAIDYSGNSTNEQVYQLRQAAKSELDLLKRCLKSVEEIDRFIDKDPRRAAEVASKLREFAPAFHLDSELRIQLEEINKSLGLLNVAMLDLRTDNLVGAIDQLQKASISSSQPLATEASQLLGRVRETEAETNIINRLLSAGKPIEASERLDNLFKLIGNEFHIPMLSKLRDEVDLAMQIDQQTNDLYTALKEQNLDVAWELYEEIRSHSSTSKVAEKACHIALPQLSDLTVDKARDIASESTNRIRAVTRASRILTPLLKYDPNNLEANNLLEVLKSENFTGGPVKLG